MTTPLRLSPPVRTLIFIWLVWAVLILGFQGLVGSRLRLARPDYVLDWTSHETQATSQSNKPYLINPFMNAQVSWDSEFYLSIAVAGYDDPVVRTASNRQTNETLSLNYAFYPLYPLTMRAVAAPLRLLGLSPIPAATLAGVIVSLLGTLAAMLGLYELARDSLGDQGGVRAAFYLLIFPSGFFLAQIYTEGLFIGLTFVALALLRRERLLLAAVLAALAVWTRAVGILLLIPIALVIIRRIDKRTGPLLWKSWVTFALAAVLPISAYLIWNAVLGRQFHMVEDNFFGRGVLLVYNAMLGWSQAFDSVSQAQNPQTPIYYLLEFASVALAVIACLFTMRRYRGEALFGLAAILFSVTSGVPQSMIRYMLVVPSIFILLAWAGRNEAFDRAWTVASILTLGMLVTLFTFDMWVA